MGLISVAPLVVRDEQPCHACMRVRERIRGREPAAGVSLIQEREARDGRAGGNQKAQQSRA